MNVQGSDSRLKLEGRKPRYSGWMGAAARRGAPPKAMPIVPTRFDTLLHELHVEEDQAATNPFMRHWIKVHYRTCYVPEPVLDQVGIPEEARAF